MFTEQQLKAAHSKVRSGADFPQYVQEIKELGLQRYKFNVADGSMIYYGANGYTVHSAAKYQVIPVAVNSSTSKLQYAITIHQQGRTDFLTFCRQAAEAGVQDWEINTQTMWCTYFNKVGDMVLREFIPAI